MLVKLELKHFLSKQLLDIGAADGKTMSFHTFEPIPAVSKLEALSSCYSRISSVTNLLLFLKVFAVQLNWCFLDIRMYL